MTQYNSGLTNYPNLLAKGPFFQLTLPFLQQLTVEFSFLGFVFVADQNSVTRVSGVVARVCY